MDKKRISTCLSLLGYAIFGIGMTLANKQCMIVYPHPQALLVFQSFATLGFCVLIVGKKKLLLKRKILVDWVPITILFSIILLSSLYALTYVSVPTLVVIRSCTSITTALAELFYRGVPFSFVGFGYLFAILFCSVLYSLEDIHFNSHGYSWLALNLVSTTFYQIIIKEVIEKHDLDALSISFYNNLLLFISMGAFEIYRNAGILDLFHMERRISFPIFISVLWGLCLSFSSSQMNRILSPTAVMVANNVNKFVLIIFSELFIEISQSSRSLLVCVFVLIFGALYSRHQLLFAAKSTSFNKRECLKTKDVNYILILLILLYFTQSHHDSKKDKVENRATAATDSHQRQNAIIRDEHFGIMLVKDEGELLKIWLEVHLGDFDYIFMIDGSSSNSTKQLINKYESIFYYHERELPLEVYTDSELRKAAYVKLTQRFGYNYWITFAYCDEFYFHDPRKVIRLAESSQVDGIEWYALHVLPHPEEYEDFLKDRNIPVVKLFRHYHHYVNGAFKEFRSFKSSVNIKFETSWSSTYPKGLTKIWELHPSYLHFKVKEINLNNYDASGHHRYTFENARRISKIKYKEKKAIVDKKFPHTGLSWPINSEKDFFVRSYLGKPKYTRCTKYNGTLISYLDDFDPSVRHIKPLPL